VEFATHVFDQAGDPDSAYCGYQLVRYWAPTGTLTINYEDA
jgi:hypothetical protein